MFDSDPALKNRQFAPVAPASSPQSLTWLLMVALSLLVYLPAALDAELLMFDDVFFFGPDNPAFQSGLWAVLTEPIANAYLPVAHLSLWLDFECGAGSSILPHVHALLVHAVAAVVLVRLLLRLGIAPLAAHVVAAIFVVHPALCESVAWVSSRKYVLSGLFTFAALLQTAHFARTPGVWRAVVLALLAAAAMFSNATSVVLPILAVGVVAWSQGTRGRWLAPAVLLLATIPIALYHQQVAAAQGTLVAGDIWERLQQAPGAFLHYLKVAVWPTRLNVLYPEVDTLAAFREQWLPGLVLALAFVLAGGALWWWRSTRALAAGLLAFVIALLPFNTAYPASSIAAADRYLYLAIPGLALAVVAATAMLHRLGPWLGALCVVPLASLASARAADFRDDATLWEASLAVADENAVAHYNLAVAIWNTAILGRRELPVEAYEEHLRAAIRAARYPIHELRARSKLSPLLMGRADYRGAADNGLAAIAAAKQQMQREVVAARREQLAKDLQRAQLDAFEPLQLSGEEAKAAEVLAEVQAAAPDAPDVIAFQAMLDLAARRPELLALARQGDKPRLAPDDAGALAVEERLKGALKEHPEHAGLWLSQALWYQARHKTSAAIRCFNKASGFRPNSVTAWLSAARMMREEGMYESALTRAQSGWQHRRDPRLLQEIALSLVGLNRLDEAEEYLSAYMKLEPDDQTSGKILSNLLIGRALQMLSDNDKRAAVRALVDDALRYHPGEPKAHLVLGRLAHREQKFDTAVGHLEKAVEMMPTYADARRHLTRSLAAQGYAAFMNRLDDRAVAAWLRCLEVAPEDFEDASAVQRQLKLAWGRIEARGIESLQAGKVDEAIRDFRKLLEIDPEQHWPAWLLATAMQGDPQADLVELERLCRMAVAWQRKNELDASRQTYLLALTLQRRGDEDGAQKLAADYMQAPDEGAEEAVLRALKRLADS